MPSGVSSRFSFTGIEYECTSRYAQVNRMDRQVLDQRVVVARQLQDVSAGQRTLAILSSSSHPATAISCESLHELPLPED